ncbi:MAG: N-acetylmuramoyl-L-alanine amidase [Nitrospirae bacterium]|nr:N-acetylmuramoyl-L-alanine amidase [Nitrospirota bacterium]
MTRRPFVLYSLVSLLWLSIGHLDRDAMGAPAATVLMERASTCDRQLLASTTLQRLRSSWQRCIQRYATLVSVYPHHPLAKTALQRQAELTKDLSRRSGNRRDVEDAEKLFARSRSMAVTPPPVTAAADTSSPETVTSSASRSRFLVVVDPGHGGKDPGAIGIGGLQEKDIVLDVAKRLQALLKSQRRLVVSLTRTDDQFLSLEARTAFAAERRADLFVSIHANASPRREAQGLETYVLGRSSDADAHATAERENTVPGERTLDTQVVIQAMLADLSDTTREEHSLELAQTVKESFVRTVGKRYPVVDLGIKRAPFYVLLNTGMPSILSEIAFLSNPEDEKRLKLPSYRQSIANALAAGITKYAASPILARSTE